MDTTFNLKTAVPLKLNTLMDGLITGFEVQNTGFVNATGISYVVKTPLEKENGDTIFWEWKLPLQIDTSDEKAEFEFIDVSHVIPISSCLIDNYDVLIKQYLEENKQDSNIYFNGDSVVLHTNYLNLNRDALRFCNILLQLDEQN